VEIQEHSHSYIELYRSGWSIDLVIKEIIISRNLYTFIHSLSESERYRLLEAIKDPDTLLQQERISLLNKLIELNMVVNGITYREHDL
jgi:hypothetical protein